MHVRIESTGNPTEKKHTKMKPDIVDANEIKLFQGFHSIFFCYYYYYSVDPKLVSRDYITKFQLCECLFGVERDFFFDSFGCCCFVEEAIRHHVRC